MFVDFIPISLCNFLYNIISKVISNKIKGKLGEFMSIEQFGFLSNK